MTCIVAFREPETENIIIAGDKMGSDSCTGMISKSPKVFTNEDFAFGYTDSFRMGQLLEHIWISPPRKIGQTTENYIYADVTTSLIKMFKDNGFGDADANEFGGFIMIYEDKIYEMQAEMSLLEHETDIVSVGSGSYHATAALQLLLEYESDIEVILQKAYDLVSYNVVSVSTQHDWIKLLIDSDEAEGTKEIEQVPKKDRQRKKSN